MAKLVTGRAGRQQRREERLEQYAAELAPLLLKQLKLTPNARVMHLGSPGAIAIGQAVAPTFESGELLIVVYSYDEMEDARAALAGLGNVEVINDIEDLDPDEQPFDIVTCIAPYQHGRDYVGELLTLGLRLLATGGTLFLAGDRQQGFERYVEMLGSAGSRVTPLAQNGQYRVVAAAKPVGGGGLRRRSGSA
jgi:16S rRNA G1207 methylase RsmC